MYLLKIRCCFIHVVTDLYGKLTLTWEEKYRQCFLWEQNTTQELSLKEDIISLKDNIFNWNINVEIDKQI